MNSKKEKSYLSPSEVARRLMLSAESVRQLAEKGALLTTTTPGGHRRYQAKDVEAFAIKQGLLSSKKVGSPHILIVDDDKALCRYLTDFFQFLDQEIVTECAYDGFEAGCKVHVFKPSIILLDLRMPGMDGFEVCQKLKANPTTRDIRILAMTGYSSEENIKNILAVGAEVCLAKPIDSKLLVQHLGLSKCNSMLEMDGCEN